LAAADPPFDAESVEIDDGDVLDCLAPVVREWWVETFGEYVPGNGGFFTPPQKEAIPLIHEGDNALVCAPTGSGKTLASFTAIINELFAKARADSLDNSVYCLYVSPLKSLANDIHRNLEVPLDEISSKLDERGEDVEIRHAIRHGDTSSSDRQAMLETTPHILNTTPETLAILLNSPKFRRKLETVEYVIVDEIHSAGGEQARHPPLGLAGAPGGDGRLLADQNRLLGHRRTPRNRRRVSRGSGVAGRIPAALRHCRHPIRPGPRRGTPLPD
jgi:Lhr-like helicases